MEHEYLVRMKQTKLKSEVIHMHDDKGNLQAHLTYHPMLEFETHKHFVIKAESFLDAMIKVVEVTGREFDTLASKNEYSSEAYSWMNWTTDHPVYTIFKYDYTLIIWEKFPCYVDTYPERDVWMGPTF